MKAKTICIIITICLSGLLPQRLAAASLHQLPDSCSLINFCGAAWSPMLDTPLGPCGRTIDWNGRSASLYYTFETFPEYSETLTDIDTNAVRVSLQQGLAAIGADWVHVTSVSGKKELCHVNLSLDDNPWCRPRNIGFGEQGRNKLGIWTVLQGGKPASVRILPETDTVYTFPNNPVRIKVSNMPRGATLTLSPNKLIIIQQYTDPAGDDNNIDCWRNLPDATYSFSDPAVTPFTVKYPEIFNMDLIMDQETLLDPVGRFAEVLVSGYYDYSFNINGVPRSFQDVDQVISLFSPLEEYCNTGKNPYWPQGYQLSYRFDDGIVYLQISCAEQLTGERVSLLPGIHTKTGNVIFFHEEPVFNSRVDVSDPQADLDSRGGFSSLTVRGYEISRGDSLFHRQFSSESQARGFFSPLLKKCRSGLVTGWDADYIPGFQFLPDSNHVLISIHGPANTGTSVRFQDTGMLNLLGQSVRFRQEHLTELTAFPDSLNWISRMAYDGNGQEACMVTYYDGLGYPEQAVSVYGAANGLNDIVQPFTFDEHDRQSQTWLPVPSDGGGLRQEHILSNQQQYYSGLYPDQMSPPRAFSETVYESSPAGRPLREHLPGAAFADSNRALRYAYSTNSTGEVLRITVDINGLLRTNGYYMAGALRRTLTQSADSCSVSVYTDLSGEKVLERQVLEEGLYADTYYVYDRLGRLTFVITPEGSKNLTDSFTAGFNSSFVLDNCFRYSYDTRGRVTGKHIPGGATVSFQYDNADRLVHQWDGSPDNGGLYYEYDVLGRAVCEKLDTLGTGANIGLKTMRTYLYDSYPHDMDFRLRFLPEDDITHPHGVSMLDERVNGLLVCENIAQIGSSSFLRRAYYYDYEGNVLQQVDLFPDGGLLRTSSSYGIRGELIGQRFRFMPHTGSGEIIYDQIRQYDRQCRLLSEELVMNGKMVSHTQYAYDDLGRVTGKTVSGGKPAAALSESFSYTLQGWLHSHLATAANGETLFASDLYYESPLDTSAVPNFSGFISQQSDCQKRFSSVTSTLLYEYDRAGRLSQTHFDASPSSVGTPGSTETGYRYDRNGNITNLSRNLGPANNEYLSFTYEGNHLVAQNEAHGFSYDHAGNLTHDPTAGIDIHWNYLNHVDTVYSSANTPVSSFSYLADGTKLEGRNGSSSTTLFYRGPFVFKSTASSTFAFESAAAPGGRIRRKVIVQDIIPDFPGKPIEGAVEPLDSPLIPDIHDFELETSCFLDRHITDHLGNVRVIVDGQGGDVLERRDYLPLGITVSDRSYPNMSENRYRFSEKEEQSTIGVPYIDFGARLYDPITGRWLSPDPLAEDNFSISPYVFCASNPVNYVDPDGNNWYSLTDINGNTKYIYYEGELIFKDILEKGYKDLGLTYTDKDSETYYSLFGKIVHLTNENKEISLEGLLYQAIDKLLIDAYTKGEGVGHAGFYFNIKPGEYVFSYDGLSFKSKRGYSGGTIYRALNNPKNSWLHNKMMPPKEERRFGGYNNAPSWTGCFMILANDSGFDVVQINFDKDNAANFNHAIYKLFSNKGK